MDKSIATWIEAARDHLRMYADREAGKVIADPEEFDRAAKFGRDILLETCPIKRGG